MRCAARRYISSNVEGGHAQLNQIMEREMAKGFKQKQLFMCIMWFCLPCHCCCMIAKASPALRPWVWDACAAA